MSVELVMLTISSFAAPFFYLSLYQGLFRELALHIRFVNFVEVRQLQKTKLMFCSFPLLVFYFLFH